MRWQTKLLAILIILSMVLVSCGTKSTTTEEDTQPQQNVEQQKEDTKKEDTKQVENKEEKKVEAKKEEKKPAVNEKKAVKATKKLIEKQQTMSIDEVKNIYFAFDSDVLSEDSQELLKKKYEWLKDKEIKIVIEGHCDERGTTAYNIALGQKRADRTKEFLINLGIDESRISTVSYGEEKAHKGASEADWAKDRRAYFNQNNME